MPMLGMQLRSLGVRVRAQAGLYVIFLKTGTQEPVCYYFYFVCMRAEKSRPALPATEEKIGRVFNAVIMSDCGKRRVIF